MVGFDDDGDIISPLLIDARNQRSSIHNNVRS